MDQSSVSEMVVSQGKYLGKLRKPELLCCVWCVTNVVAILMFTVAKTFTSRLVMTSF